jgi:ABC-type transporter Mla MlaB component
VDGTELIEELDLVHISLRPIDTGDAAGLMALVEVDHHRQGEGSLQKLRHLTSGLRQAINTLPQVSIASK